MFRKGILFLCLFKCFKNIYSIAIYYYIIFISETEREIFLVIIKKKREIKKKRHIMFFLKRFVNNLCIDFISLFLKFGRSPDATYSPLRYLTMALRMFVIHLAKHRVRFLVRLIPRR